MFKKLLTAFLGSSMLIFGFPVLAQEVEPVEEMETVATQEMYRLYNRSSGEHFYTKDGAEKDTLVKGGWRYEGIGWYAPQTSNTPVYRLYNKNSADHHYTTDGNERDALIRAGWMDEGISWYSDDSQRVPIYRQYNPNAKTGNHNYTTSKDENNSLCAVGWKAEGIGWYAIKEGKPAPVELNPTPAVVDYAAYYRPILDEAKKIVNTKGHGNYRDDLYGVVEWVTMGSATLDSFGYTIQDFSGDGIPELAIVDRVYEGDILSLYTLVNGKPVNVFYGWARSRNLYAGGSSFIYNGSGGAMSVVTGLFSLSKDGRNMNFSEYYYTEPSSSGLDLNTYSSAGPNTTGKYIGSGSVYTQKSNQIFAKKKNLNLTPLSQWK